MRTIKINGKDKVLYFDLHQVDTMFLDGDEISISTQSGNTEYISFPTKKKAKEVFEDLLPLIDKEYLL